MIELPPCEFLRVERRDWVLHLTLDRPEVRNALSFAMADEIGRVFAAVAGKPTEVRAVVLRGAQGHFCAGADIGDMASLLRSSPDPLGGQDPIATANRRFGTLLESISSAPQVVVALLEGSVMGGGFGLACASDVVVAHRDVVFRLPETRLGLIPAQILPFVLRRFGEAATRRLALAGASMSARQAQTLGFLAAVVEDDQAISQTLDLVLRGIGNCEPRANASTKALLTAALDSPLAEVLDQGAHRFAQALRSDAAQRRTAAFLSKKSRS